MKTLNYNPPPVGAIQKEPLKLDWTKMEAIEIKRELKKITRETLNEEKIRKLISKTLGYAGALIISDGVRAIITMQDRYGEVVSYS